MIERFPRRMMRNVVIYGEKPFHAEGGLHTIQVQDYYWTWGSQEAYFQSFETRQTLCCHYT